MKMSSWKKKLFTALLSAMMLAGALGFSLSALAATSIEAANIRATASTEANLLGVLYPGQQAKVIGEVVGTDGTTWYHIEVVTEDGVTINGYVKGSLLTGLDDEVEEPSAGEAEQETETPAEEPVQTEEPQAETPEVPAADTAVQQPVPADFDPMTDPAAHFEMRYRENGDGTGSWYAYNTDTGREFEITDSAAEAGEGTTGQAADAEGVHSGWRMAAIVLGIIALAVIGILLFLMRRINEDRRSSKAARAERRQNYFREEEDEEDEDSDFYEDEEEEDYGEETEEDFEEEDSEEEDSEEEDFEEEDSEEESGEEDYEEDNYYRVDYAREKAAREAETAEDDSGEEEFPGEQEEEPAGETDLAEEIEADRETDTAEDTVLSKQLVPEEDSFLEVETEPEEDVDSAEEPDSFKEVSEEEEDFEEESEEEEDFEEEEDSEGEEDFEEEDFEDDDDLDEDDDYESELFGRGRSRERKKRGAGAGSALSAIGGFFKKVFASGDDEDDDLGDDDLDEEEEYEDDGEEAPRSKGDPGGLFAGAEFEDGDPDDFRIFDDHMAKPRRRRKEPVARSEEDQFEDELRDYPEDADLLPKSKPGEAEKEYFLEVEETEWEENPEWEEETDYAPEEGKEDDPEQSGLPLQRVMRNVRVDEGDDYLSDEDFEDDLTQEDLESVLFDDEDDDMEYSFLRPRKKR